MQMKNKLDNTCLGTSYMHIGRNEEGTEKSWQALMAMMVVGSGRDGFRQYAAMAMAELAKVLVSAQILIHMQHVMHVYTCTVQAQL